jgi:hypothetical protein
MQPFAVARGRFDRMAEGMAEVEQRRATRLALVLGDDLGLDLARAPDGMRERGRVAPQQLVGVRLDPVEERQVAYRAVLGDLREPAAYSRGGSDARVAVSAITAQGWWKAPTMFLPSA